jgi:chromatin structure-remodeling complex subunit RSC1/2
MLLLKGDEKVVAEGDKVPEPVEIGSEDAPPTIGAIYRGDSPEPEKEPTPPPPPPQPVIPEHRRLSTLEPMSMGLPQPMPYKNPVSAPVGQQYRGLTPQMRYPTAPTRQVVPPPQPPPEQPLAFTMPVSVPPEVAELLARDNQGRVLWFGVPPVDVVGWSGGEGVRGHTLEYLAKKRKRRNEIGEHMQDVMSTANGDDKGYKKQASEILVKALGMIGK